MTAPPAEGWTASAYGMCVEGVEPVAGLTDQPRWEHDAPAGRPVVRLVVGEGEGWREDAAVALRSGPPGAIDACPGAGWRLSATEVEASFRVDGAAAVVHRPPELGEHARAYLLGQVLPFVAGLRGVELLHAAAVVRDGRAIALAGPSGAGKSTLAAALRQEGCEAVTDDVLAVDQQLRAHAGPVAGDAAPVRPFAPLAAVCFLVRGAAGAVAPLPEDDAAPALLGAAYDALRRDAARLRAQLEQCARIAAGASLWRVEIGPESTPEQLASAVLDAL